MAAKLIAVFACIAAVNAVVYPAYHAPAYAGYHAPAYAGYHAAPVVKYAAPIVKTVEYSAPAHYDFTYSVHDAHTGDIKSQSESRKGDVVHGQYSLVDPDGYQRIVDYTADPHNGFNAVVRREPLGHKVAVAAAPIAKVVAAAPVAHYAAPVAHYGAPLAHAFHY